MERKHGNIKHEPTPDEIRERTEAIQSEWSDDQRRQREGCFARQSWTPLRCHVHCEEPGEEAA